MHFLQAYHKANEERKEIHQELLDTRSLLNMIKEKNEIQKEKSDALAKEKTGITYRVGVDTIHNGQLLSSRKTPTFHRGDPIANNGRTSTITIINHQSQTPHSKSNYLPSIYTSHSNVDSRLSEHAKKLM